MRILLPAGIILMVFWIYHLMRYSREYWETLTLQKRDAKSDIAACMVAWLEFAAGVATSTYLIHKYVA